MAQKKLFKSKSGKSFDDVRTLIGSDYVLKRTTHNTRKFILTDSQSNEKYFKFQGSIGDMFSSIEKSGIDIFVKKNQISDVQPKKGKAVKKAKVKAQKKEKVQKVKATKKKKVSNKKQIEKLEAEEIKITLRLMDMSLVRNSKAHLAIRKELHEINDKLNNLGREDWDTKMGNLSADDMREAKELGKQKRAAKKAKDKQLQTFLSSGSKKTTGKKKKKKKTKKTKEKKNEN